MSQSLVKHVNLQLLLWVPSLIHILMRVTEKRGFIWPYLKKIELDVNDLSNYRPVTNLAHLSKIIELAMLD